MGQTIDIFNDRNERISVSVATQNGTRYNLLEETYIAPKQRKPFIKNGKVYVAVRNKKKETLYHPSEKPFREVKREYSDISPGKYYVDNFEHDENGSFYDMSDNNVVSVTSSWKNKNFDVINYRMTGLFVSVATLNEDHRYNIKERIYISTNEKKKFEIEKKLYVSVQINDGRTFPTLYKPGFETYRPGSKRLEGNERPATVDSFILDAINGQFIDASNFKSLEITDEWFEKKATL